MKQKRLIYGYCLIDPDYFFWSYGYKNYMIKSLLDENVKDKIWSENNFTTIMISLIKSNSRQDSLRT